LRKSCGEVVNNEKVQSLIVLLIAINAVMMGLATFHFVYLNPPVNAAFESVDMVFLIIFTAELILQLIYRGLGLFLDGWLLFDFTIIILTWPLPSLQVIRAFRIFRALRMVNRITVLRNLVQALATVMPQLSSITLLLCLIFYIFSVFFTDLFGSLYEEGALEGTDFIRMDNSLFTLFQIMTLDDWDSLTRHFTGEIAWSWFPLLIHVVLTALIALNLVVGVMCKSVSALEAKQKAKLMGDTLIEERRTQENALCVRLSNQRHIHEELLILQDRLQKLCNLQDMTLQALELLTNHEKVNVRT
jgi:hypothetical protein